VHPGGVRSKAATVTHVGGVVREMRQSARCNRKLSFLRLLGLFTKSKGRRSSAVRFATLFSYWLCIGCMNICIGYISICIFLFMTVIVMFSYFRSVGVEDITGVIIVLFLRCLLDLIFSLL